MNKIILSSIDRKVTHMTVVAQTVKLSLPSRRHTRSAQPL